MTDRSHLVLPPGAHLDAGPVSRLLAPLLNTPVADVALQLRYGGGWVLRNATPELADEVERSLRDELDLELVRLPHGFAPEVPPVRRVHSIVFDERELHVTCGREEETHELASLAAVFVQFLVTEEEVEEEVEQRDLGSLVAADRDFASHREALTRPGLTLERGGLYLMLPEPIELLRIEIGTTMPELALDGQVNTLDNWLRLLDHVGRHAPDGVLPETRRLLDDADPTGTFHEKREEFDHRLMWISELVASGLWGSAYTDDE